jgi:hypothetical protein
MTNETVTATRSFVMDNAFWTATAIFIIAYVYQQDGLFQ